MTLAPGARFAVTKRWSIDVNDYGKCYHELYHVMRTTSKGVWVYCTTLFDGSLNVDGNAKLDKVIRAHMCKTPLPNEDTAPRLYMLKNDSKKGAYFGVGHGTAYRSVYIAEVTFFQSPTAQAPLRPQKRSRV